MRSLDDTGCYFLSPTRLGIFFALASCSFRSIVGSDPCVAFKPETTESAARSSGTIASEKTPTVSEAKTTVVPTTSTTTQTTVAPTTSTTTQTTVASKKLPIVSDPCVAFKPTTTSTPFNPCAPTTTPVNPCIPTTTPAPLHVEVSGSTGGEPKTLQATVSIGSGTNSGKKAFAKMSTASASSMASRAPKAMSAVSRSSSHSSAPEKLSLSSGRPEHKHESNSTLKPLVIVKKVYKFIEPKKKYVVVTVQPSTTSTTTRKTSTFLAASTSTTSTSTSTTTFLTNSSDFLFGVSQPDAVQSFSNPAVIGGIALLSVCALGLVRNLKGATHVALPTDPSPRTLTFSRPEQEDVPKTLTPQPFPEPNPNANQYRYAKVEPAESPGGFVSVKMDRGRYVEDRTNRRGLQSLDSAVNFPRSTPQREARYS